MAIFPYHGPLNWPDLPAAIAECYLQRYADYALEYGERWARLDAISSVPSDPGGEVFEAAETTVRTFYSDEQWFGDIDNPDPILVYSSPVTGQDWLDLRNNLDVSAGFLHWRESGNLDYPLSTAFSSSLNYISCTWIVWRMHQLLIAEELYRVQRLNWREVLDD